MATDVITIGNRISQLDSSEKFYPLSKVVYRVNSEGATFQVGDNTGRSIEANNPFASSLPPVRTAWFKNSLAGLSYQPYSADGALLDPAAEIGDAASMSGVYGGIYNRRVNFSPLMKANISAPTDEEINHEYKFETEQERKFSRTTSDLRASIMINAEAIALEAEDRRAADASILSVTATEIAAKVSSEGGNNSFSWALTADGHEWKSNGTTVMKINRDGLSVKGNGEFTGKITASSGRIGGFTISASAIYNGISSFDGDGTSGVYVGTNGIRLGSGFKVSPRGAVTASNLAITGGSIAIGDAFRVSSSGAVTASNLAITGGSIAIGDAFRVSSRGAVTASNLAITGGSISIGDNFRVSSNGNVTASNLSITGGSISIGNNFRVTNQGNVTANDMRLSGTLTIGGSTITAERLRQGAQDGYDWSNGSYQGTTPQNYALGGAAGGIRFNNATNSGSGSYPSFFRAAYLYASSQFVCAGNFQVLGRYATDWATDSWYDRDGNYHFIRYLTS